MAHTYMGDMGAFAVGPLPPADLEDPVDRLLRDGDNFVE